MKMKNRIVKFNVMLFAVLLFFAANVSYASDGAIKLFVSPQKFEFKAKRGDVINDKIKIYNRGESPIALEAVAGDFSAEEESGTINFSGSLDGNEDVRKWIKIERSNFILDSQEKEEIYFEIEIPKETEDGGKYAVIFFQPKKISQSLEDKTLEILPKIGVLFLISIGDVDAQSPQATIAEFSIPEKYHLKKAEDLVLGATGLFSHAQAEEKNEFAVVETAELPFILRIKNSAIYHIKPEGKLSIFSMDGRLLGETQISKTTILPGKTRKILVEFSSQSMGWLERYMPLAAVEFMKENLIWGKYKANLILDLENNGSLEKTLEFWIFPWKTVTAIFMLIVFLLFFKKRMIMAGKILFFKQKKQKT